MKGRGTRVLALGAVFASVLLAVASASASEIPIVVDAIAARLEQNQIKGGVSTGDWESEWGLNGPIVAGLVDAYGCTGNESYRASAVLGAEFIVWEARYGAFLGDEVYAILRLGAIDDQADEDTWRAIVEGFFRDVGSTSAEVFSYTDLYKEMDPSTAVFYLAHFAVAAHEVGADGAAHWREALIDHLARVGDEEAECPVMALGVATWSLVQTGPLDDTLVDRPGAAQYWEHVRLCDLPRLLAGHQVPDGEPFGGSFYWRFDHTLGPFSGEVAGYTEDAIYGTLGLVAFASLEENSYREDLKGAIRIAAMALLAGVDTDGAVYERLSREGMSYYAYAGEMLQALCRVRKYLAAPDETGPAQETIPIE